MAMGAIVREAVGYPRPEERRSPAPEQTRRSEMEETRSAEPEQTPRMAATQAAGLEELPPEEEMRQIVELAAEICGAPVGLLSLLDSRWQTVLASVGMRVPQIPREMTMCAHTLTRGDLMVVEDTMKDLRFAGHPMVTGDPEIRFYAGIPLHRPTDGMAIGTLCVVDMRPRALSATQERSLRVLGKQFQTRLELLAEQRALERALRERDQKDMRLKRSEEMFRVFMNNGPLETFMKDSDGRYVYYNAKVAERFRISEREWLGKTDFDLFPEAVARQFRERDMQALESRGATMSEDTVEIEGKTVVWRSYKFGCEDESGQVLLAGMSMDVTEMQKQAAELDEAHRELEKVAMEDPLTGLATRRMLDERLEQEFLRAQVSRQVLSLMIVDIDHFADRNQRMGDSEGDKALQKVGAVVKRCVADGDLAVRYGADEVTVLMPETTPEEAKQFAERLQRELRKEDWGRLPLTVSIGIATTQHAVRSARQLFCFADEAMYRAKDTGRDRAVMYVPRT